MHILRSSRKVAHILIFMGSCLLLVFSTNILAESKIILNPSVGEQNLDSIYLNQIFAMQVRKWPNGQPINVFILSSDSRLHRHFTLNKLRIHSHQLDRIWNRMLFTGTGRTPSRVESEAEMLEAVKTTPGAIGYVSESFQTEGVILSGDAK